MLSLCLWAGGVAFLFAASFRPAPTSAGLNAVRKDVRTRFAGVRHLPPESLFVWLQDRSEYLAIIDARTPEEYAASHIPGAIRMDYDMDGGEALKRLALPNDYHLYRPVVVYCSVGYRSSMLAHQLQNRGMTRVYNLDGSIFRWAQLGYPLERDGQPVTTVHPYNEKWGRLIDKSLHAK